MSIRSVNPATGALLKAYKEDSSRELSEKIVASSQAFQEWKKLAVPVRTKLLARVGELLRGKRDELAALITAEMGKPLRESQAEIEKCAWACAYYADNAKLFLKDEIVKTDHSQSYVSFEPLGVVLAVMPWNFPFWQVIRFAAPALAAGNCALLKHASNVPQCAEAIQQLFLDAGYPEGVFTTLFISSSKVKTVVAHPAVVAVTVTGSEAAGSKVAELAGKYIKKSVLELGGSDPFIVLREANLKKAAKAIIQSRMLNAGQSCIAAKRLIVEECVAASLLKLLEKEWPNIRMGDPMAADIDVGPLAKEEFVKAVHEQVRQSVKKGARLVAGGSPIKRKGYFYPPTLVADVKQGMPLFDEEVFGPVLPVIMAKDEEEAILLANTSDFGLGAAIWTENADLAGRLARHLYCGNVVVNGIVASDPRMPFGGVKKSGYGRELSEYGIKEFVNIKSVIINS